MDISSLFKGEHAMIDTKKFVPLWWLDEDQ